MRTTSVRLPEEYMGELEEACKLEGVDKGTMLRKLIGVALKEYRIKRALEQQGGEDVPLEGGEQG